MRALHELKRELGLGPGATRKDIRKRFLELAHKLHPDKSTSEDAKSRYIRMKDVYGELMARLPPDRKQLPEESRHKVHVTGRYTGTSHQGEKSKHAQQVKPDPVKMYTNQEMTDNESESERNDKLMEELRVSVLLGCAVAVGCAIVYIGLVKR